VCCLIDLREKDDKKKDMKIDDDPVMVLKSVCTRFLAYRLTEKEGQTKKKASLLTGLL